MKRIIASVTANVILIIFVIFGFGHFYGEAHSDILGKELEERARQSFKGVITLWQVDSFEGGVGSRTAWLNSALSRLEKRYNGVYFVVKSVSVELLPTLLAQSRPDLISFGHGVFTQDQALELFEKIQYNGEPLIPSLLKSTDGYAVPLFFGGYCLLTANQYTSFTSYPDDIAQCLSQDFGTVSYNKQKRAVVPLVAGDYNTSLAALALALGFGSVKKEAHLCSSDALWDHYNYNELSASALVSQRQLYRLSAATDKGKGRKSQVLNIYPYTDMVQYLAVFKGGSDKKQRVMSAVIEHLTSTAIQMTLSSIGIMPSSLAALAAIKYENQYMQTLCDGYRDKHICLPHAFASLDNVSALAQEHLAGKSDGFNVFAQSLIK